MGGDFEAVAGQHAREDRIPPFGVQLFQDSVAGIPETAGEFERPDPAVVDDCVQIDVAAVARGP